MTDSNSQSQPTPPKSDSDRYAVRDNNGVQIGASTDDMTDATNRAIRASRHHARPINIFDRTTQAVIGRYQDGQAVSDVQPKSVCDASTRLRDIANRLQGICGADDDAAFLRLLADNLQSTD